MGVVPTRVNFPQNTLVRLVKWFGQLLKRAPYTGWQTVRQNIHSKLIEKYQYPTIVAAENMIIFRQLSESVRSQVLPHRPPPPHHRICTRANDGFNVISDIVFVPDLVMKRQRMRR